MRFLSLILLTILVSNLGAEAFLWFGKKDKENKKEILLNEEVLIDSKYQSYDGIFKIKLAIHIAPNSSEIKIISFDDELNEFQIDKVNWIVEQRPDEAKLHKLFKPRKIEPIQTSIEVNELYESYSVDFDPNKAYDRISDNKHILNKYFIFKKDKVFKENKEKIAHFLEITFSNGMKKLIRIEEKIYQEPIDVTTGIFPKDRTQEEHNPYAKYEEINNANKDLDARQAAEKARKEILEHGDGGYSPLEYKVLPEAGVPAGSVNDYYTDPGGQNTDETFLDLYE